MLIEDDLIKNIYVPWEQRKKDNYVEIDSKYIVGFIFLLVMVYIAI